MKYYGVTTIHRMARNGRDGADGISPVVYALVVSYDNIVKDTDGNLSPASITVRILKTIGNASGYVTTSGNNLRLSVSVDGGTPSALYIYTAANGTTLSTSDTGKYLRFILTDSTTGAILVTKTVSVVNEGEQGPQGEQGRPGESAVYAICSPSGITIDCNSAGKALSSAINQRLGITMYQGGLSVPDMIVSSINGNSTGTLTQGGITLTWNGSNLFYSYDTTTVLFSVVFNAVLYSNTVGASRPVSISFMVAKQGAQGVRGLTGQMLRNRGTFNSAAALGNTDETFWNNNSWCDYVRYRASSADRLLKYRLDSGVTEWTKTYYIKSGTTYTTSEPRLPNITGSNTSDGVWAVFSEVNDISAGLLIADSLASGSANMANAFIGDTSDGVEMSNDGSLSVSNTANGWAINGGRIRHTKTGVELTSDGFLKAPAWHIITRRVNDNDVSLEDELMGAGIDIEGGRIILRSEQLLCKNIDGEKTMWLDGLGNLCIRGVYGRTETMVTSANYNKYLYRRSQTVYDVDINRLEGIVYLSGLHQDDSTATLRLPYAAYTANLNEDVLQTQVIDQDSYGGHRGITGSELRMAVGRRIVLVNQTGIQIRVMSGPIYLYYYDNQNGENYYIYGGTTANGGLPMDTGSVLALELIYEQVKIGISYYYCYFWRTQKQAASYGNIDNVINNWS